MVYFAELNDVRSALQKRALDAPTGDANNDDGPLAEDIVEDAIRAASDWFRRATNGHWFDSTATTSDLVDSSAASTSQVKLDVPSSPHRQRGQLTSSYTDAQYPVTTTGPYARVKLPHPFVNTVTSLQVRERGGGVEDWVSASDKVEGVGEDYYIAQPGQNSYGRSYLYIRASSIGARHDFGNILTLDYDFGLDYQTGTWDDVKRGVAHLAAAELVDDDSVLAQIPDNGQLVGVQTQRENLVQRADKELGPYLSSGVV